MTYENSIHATRWRDLSGIDRPVITPRSSLPATLEWGRDERLDVHDLLALLHPAWHKRAACANPYPPEDPRHREHVRVWYPTRGEQVQRIAKVCESCPVSVECAMEAVTLPKSYPGVRAGHGHKQRKRDAAKREAS